MRKSVVLFFTLAIPLMIAAQNRMSRDEYIDEYKELAMREMMRSGVPASITLAQGMLESDNGNSTLARKGNNHFGIKCHTDWKGKKIHQDDDHKNECFRKYKSVYDSYVDHSDFLKYRTRYASLFELEITDYKGWARGLKKAGYATNRQYDDLLIRIIEENELHQYDLLALQEYEPEEGRLFTGMKETSKRPILINNRIDYIIVQDGDTYESLNRELRLLKGELFRYNELTADSLLRTGQILYLQPKRNHSEIRKKEHIVKEGESLYQISQMYGIKLEKLCEKNLMEPDDSLVAGTKLLLRKRLRPVMHGQEELEDSGDDEMRFQFEE